MTQHDNKIDIDASSWPVIRQHALFEGISDEGLFSALPFFQLISYKPGEVVIEEGSCDSRDLFLILKGNLDVIKKTSETTSDKSLSSTEQFIVARLGENDLIGELSFIKGRPRAASIKCITRSELLVINPEQVNHLASINPVVFGKLMRNLSGYVASRLEKTTHNEVKALKTELENSMLNAKANLFFSYVIGLLCVYNLTISKISELSIDANKASIISALIIVAFALGLIFMIQQSKLPIYVMGLTLRKWKPALKESLIWSGVIILGLIVAKWILITSIPRYEHLTLFDLDLSQNAIGLNFILYGLHSPIQEFVARGVLQGSLQHFFTGKNITLRAIIVSNALFSATHVHLMQGVLGLIVFVPGIFWGYLYARHNTLLGVSVSHLLIGWVGLFFLNPESLFV